MPGWPDNETFHNITSDPSIFLPSSLFTNSIPIPQQPHPHHPSSIILHPPICLIRNTLFPVFQISLRNSPHFIHSKNTHNSSQHFEFVFLSQCLSKMKTFGLDLGGNQIKIAYCNGNQQSSKCV